jgi:hypothetical protein
MARSVNGRLLGGAYLRPGLEPAPVVLVALREEVAELVGADQHAVHLHRRAHPEQGHHARGPEREPGVDRLVAPGRQLLHLGRLVRELLDPVHPVDAGQALPHHVDQVLVVARSLPLVHDRLDALVHLAVQHVGGIGDVAEPVGNRVGLVRLRRTRRQDERDQRRADAARERVSTTIGASRSDSRC